MRHTIWTTLVVVLAFVLTACGGSEPVDDKPKLTQPKAGQCVAEQVKDGEDLAPDVETVVPCTEPHVFEIVGVYDVPKKFLSGKTDKQKLARRTELAAIGPKTSKLSQELDGVVWPKCRESIRKATGLDKVKVGSKTASDLNVGLASGNASNWMNISSPKLWVEGETKALCAVRYTSQKGKEDAVIKQVTAPNDKPLISRFLSASFPVDLRRCIDPGTEVRTPCTKLHDQEILWTLDIKAAYGKGFLKGTKLNDMSDGNADKINSACAKSYKSVGGKISDFNRGGFRYFKESDPGDSSLEVICTLTVKRDDMALGTDFLAF